MPYVIVRHQDIAFCIQQNKLQVTEDYLDNPQAYYEDFSIGHVYDNIAHSHWASAQCKVAENLSDETLIKIFVALKVCEDNYQL